MTSVEALRAEIEQIRQTARALEEQVAQVIVGQRSAVRGVTIALLAGGHVLLEGVPGLGKTLLVRSFAQALSLRYSRIQFTPDLMPADVVGTNVLVEEGGRRAFRFQPGPIFANLVLADEINRATPKTQSALLEAMQEQSVTVGDASYPLEAPFFVLATQNPIELEGTYPLPEAELDRFFFKLHVRFPSRTELAEIMARTTGRAGEEPQPVTDGATVVELQQLVREIPIATHVADYAVRLVLATHPDLPESPDTVRRFLRYGASPRAGQAMILAAKLNAVLNGRVQVSFEDIRLMAPPALRHRVVPSYEADARGMDADALVKQVLEAVPEEA